LKSDQIHTDHILNEQRESLPIAIGNSLPTLLCFNFFPTAQKKLIFYCHRTNGTFVFIPHTSPTLRKTKRATFCPRTNDDNAILKLNLADYKNFKY
jgi:hypothetical protein